MAEELQFELHGVISKIATELKKKCNIYFDGKNLLSLRIALDIIFDNYDSEKFLGENRGYLVIDDDNSDILFYYNGVYIDGDVIIRAIVQMVLGDKVKNQWVTEVLGAVKRIPSIRIKREFLDSYKDLINVRNGVYNTETKELLEHDKKYYFTNKLDVFYNKDAKCPKIEKFMEEVHNMEDIPIIQELFGYCLYPTYLYHKIFFFLGIGRNGKGTELNLLTRMLGKENISSIAIHTLIEQPHKIAELCGKVANICGDIGSRVIEETNMLKLLSGMDTIDADRKFGQPFQYINRAKLIYASNDPPLIKDRTDAIWERLIYVTFPNQFLDKAKGTDPNLLEKLTTDEEISGLFNWAIEGLIRLKINKGFTYNKSVDENRLDYDRKSNSVLAFSQDELTYLENNYILKKDIKIQLSAWCIKHKIKQVSESILTKRLVDAIPGCESERIMINGDRKQVYMNIAFKNNMNSDENEIQSSSQSQKKLDFSESLTDRINGLLTCFEMNDGIRTDEQLEDEGFEKTFIEKCIEQKIIYRLPDGTLGVCQ